MVGGSTVPVVVRVSVGSWVGVGTRGGDRAGGDAAAPSPTTPPSGELLDGRPAGLRDRLVDFVGAVAGRVVVVDVQAGKDATDAREDVTAAPHATAAAERQAASAAAGASLLVVGSVKVDVGTSTSTSTLRPAVHLPRSRRRREVKRTRRERGEIRGGCDALEHQRGLNPCLPRLHARRCLLMLLLVLVRSLRKRRRKIRRWRRRQRGR